MKNFLLLLTCVFILSNTAQAIEPPVSVLVENQKFQFIIEDIIPSVNVNLENYKPSGQICIKDSITSAKMPYFGITDKYNNNISDKDIEFKNKSILNPNIEYIKKKDEIKSIKYSFDIKDNEQNSYSMTMYIKKDGNCRIEFSSNNKSDMVYIGKIKAI